MARFLVQTIPNKLPELLINLSSQGPHLMGATLPTLLRAVHPGTIAMTDFRQRICCNVWNDVLIIAVAELPATLNITCWLLQRRNNLLLN